MLFRSNVGESSSDSACTGLCLPIRAKNPEAKAPGINLAKQPLCRKRSAGSRLINMTLLSFYLSSLIQTILSVLEFHQVSRPVLARVNAWKTTGRGLSPPVGNCTLPRRTFLLFCLRVLEYHGNARKSSRIFTL